MRTGPGVWVPLGHPAYLRQQCELSCRRLGVEALDLFQLHRVDPEVDADEQFGTLAELLEEGKVKAVGLSEVTVGQIEAAAAIVKISTVQNLYNLSNRQSEAVLEFCEREQIGFIPWFPLATGELARSGGPLDSLAAELGASPSQVALAWLLARSPVMLPIPGTSKVSHVEENCAAARIELNAAQLELLEQLST